MGASHFLKRPKEELSAIPTWAPKARSPSGGFCFGVSSECLMR